MRHPLRPRLTALCLSLLLAVLPPAQAEDTPADEAPPAASERPFSERSADAAATLQQRLPDEEQQWLEADGERFLALWQPANVEQPSGVIILIPGDGETADWPRAIGPLRRKLPDTGWHTLSLTLPDPQDGLPLRAAEPPTPEEAPDAAADEPQADEQAAATDAQAEAPVDIPAAASPEARLERHAARVLARLRAALAFAERQEPESIIFLGHASGAYWAARYLAEEPAPRIHNLLMVAARSPEGFGPALEQLIPNLRLATGDFYYKDDPAARTAARKRLQTARRQPLPAYLQIAMTSLPGNPAVEQEQLFRRIKGWLLLQLRAQHASGT
ncbi:alpha/beta hydrolase family protein [Zestomonas thermotolerans]|uniref:alpha/beta hydrolase family protein n=1 Tax=Zestomonas thermotolerans TaxID=157784 RepID=UPI0023F22079|nr:alpha/beta hydrolase family protein [Pseudomonas thermotolerans]